jgi:hypothetical protein
MIQAATKVRRGLSYPMSGRAMLEIKKKGV